MARFIIRAYMGGSEKLCPILQEAGMDRRRHGPLRFSRCFSCLDDIPSPG